MTAFEVASGVGSCLALVDKFGLRLCFPEILQTLREASVGAPSALVDELRASASCP